MPIDWDNGVLAPLEAVFGEPATFLPAGGHPLDIVGVFDVAYHEIATLDPLSANASMPVLGVRLSQFLMLPLPDDQVHVPSVGKHYLIVDVRPDSHGWAKLMLSECNVP